MTARRILKSSAFLLLGLASLLSAEALLAQQIPALEDVPRALPDPPVAALVQRHGDLAARRASLFARIDDFNQRCRLYYANSPEAKACPAQKGPLYADRDAYVAAVKSFNWDLEQAIGEYRNKLEKRLVELDRGLAMDARAIESHGFARRAEDFEELAKLSTDAHRLAFTKVMEVIVAEGSDLLVKGVVEQLRALRATGLGPDEAKELLRKFDDRNLVNSKAREYLRRVAQGLTPGRGGELAGALHEDIRTTLEIVKAGGKGENLEAASKLLQWVAPSGSGIMEIAVWVGYDITAQTLVTARVRGLTHVTEQQLKALNAIVCVTQRRLAEKFEVSAKLAAIDEKPFNRTKPFLSDQCAARR